MKRYICLLLILCAGATCFSLDADDVLVKVDAHRAIGLSFSFRLKIEDYSKGVLSQTAVMTGHVKGADKTMVQYEEPDSMKGKKLLMVDDDLFIFVPKTQRPVRLTASQRLMGQASNGDVMNVRYQTDYSPVLSGEETITVDSKSTECLILDLSAKRKSSPYSKIVLWVDKKSYCPVKADCYALSGKKLKTVEYSMIKKFGGEDIIAKAILYDLVIKENYTVIEFLEMAAEDISDNYFNKEFLLRM